MNFTIVKEKVYICLSNQYAGINLYQLLKMEYLKYNFFKLKKNSITFSIKQIKNY